MTVEQQREIKRIVKELGIRAKDPKVFYEEGKPRCDMSTLSDNDFYKAIQEEIYKGD